MTTDLGVLENALQGKGNLMTLAERMHKLLEELDGGLIEREDIFRLAFLAVLTGQPTYLYGRAGAGKRAIINHLLAGFSNLQVQTYGLRHFDLPQAPIDLAIFTNFDSGFQQMTSAIDSFLGEHLAHSLILSGRARPDAALPEAKLADSIHLVLTFPDSVSPNALETLLSKAGDPQRFSVTEELKISKEEMRSWEKELENVAISQDSLSLLQAIATECEQGNIYISASRWRGLAKIARLQALIANRSETSITDFLFLSKDLWGKRAANEAIRKGFDKGIEHFLNTYAPNQEDLKKTFQNLLNQTEHFKNSSGNRYKTENIDGEEYIRYNVTVFNESIALYVPLSRLGTHEDFFPLNSLHREETRAKCNFMGGDICKISIDAKAKRNGMRASSLIAGNPSASTNTVYEDYAKLPSEILQTNVPEIIEQNKIGLQNAHEQLFDILNQVRQSIKNLKALYQKYSGYQSDPFLLMGSYKDFMNLILKRYKALGDFSKELQQYEALLAQASTGIA